jgi:uroporphyrinogen-III synthase
MPARRPPPRVAVLRGAARAGSLVERLREAGFEPVELPVLAFEDLAPPCPGPCPSPESTRWVFTSVEGPAAWARQAERWEREGAAGWQGASLRGVAAIVVGRATEAAARDAGFEVEYCGEGGDAGAMVEGWVASRRAPDRPELGCAVAPAARDAALEAAARAGFVVRRIEVYRSVPNQAARERIEATDPRGLAVIAATASSTLSYLDALLPPGRRAAWRTVPVVSIGPATSTTARELGYTVAAQAGRSTLDALVEAVQSRFEPEET